MTAPGGATANAEHDNARLAELLADIDGLAELAALEAAEAKRRAGAQDDDPAGLAATAAAEARAAVRTLAAAVRAHGANYLDTARALDHARPLRRLLRLLLLRLRRALPWLLLRRAIIDADG